VQKASVTKSSIDFLALGVKSPVAASSSSSNFVQTTKWIILVSMPYGQSLQRTRKSAKPISYIERYLHSLNATVLGFWNGGAPLGVKAIQCNRSFFRNSITEPCSFLILAMYSWYLRKSEGMRRNSSRRLVS
jgi:hypothetical protein